MKFKILTLMFVGISIFTSCKEDDEIQEIQIEGNEVVLTPTVTLDNGNFGLEGQNLDYTVTLPTSFSSDATVTVSVGFSDATSSFSDSAITIPAGETQGNGSLILNSIGGTNPFSGINTTIGVKGIILAETDGNNYVISSDSLINFPLYEEFVDDSDDLTVSIDWDESAATADLDIALWTEFGTFAGSVSQTSSRFEEFTFGSDLNDGTYELRFRNFAQDQAVLALNVFLKNADDTVELFQKEIPNPVTFPTAWFPAANDNILFTIVKTTDNTDPDNPVASYTVTAL